MSLEFALLAGAAAIGSIASSIVGWVNRKAAKDKERAEEILVRLPEGENMNREDMVKQLIRELENTQSGHRLVKGQKASIANGATISVQKAGSG